MSAEHALPSDMPRTLHVANLATTDYDPSGRDRPAIDDPSEANVISSIRRGGGNPTTHYPVLDLDIPAYLVPSSTPGHSHLYLDVELLDADYWALCDVLATYGILEPGYVSACKERGYTSVRLPWVRKEEAES